MLANTNQCTTYTHRHIFYIYIISLAQALLLLPANLDIVWYDFPKYFTSKFPIEKHPTFFVRSSSLLPPFTSERQRNEKMSFGGHSEKNDWQTIPSAFFHSIIVQSVPSSFYIEVA